MAPSEQAAKVVDALSSDWIKPIEQAAQLPPAAHGLAAVLRSAETVRSAAAFAAADVAAGAAQKQHKSYAKGAAAMSFAAALIAALMLYLGVTWQSGPTGAALAMVQVAAWVLLAWYMLCLKRSRPYETWGSERGKAETARVKHFLTLLTAAAPEGIDQKELAPYTLEYVRRYLIDDQKRWFDKRFRDFRWKRWGLLFRRVLAFALVIAPGLLLVATLFANVMPAAFVEWSLVPDIGKAMSLASVIGGSWHALEMNIAGIDMVDRNAATYRKMAARIASVAGPELEKARAAASHGDSDGLAGFGGSFSELLLSEQASWGGALEIGQLLAMSRIGRGSVGHEHGVQE